MALGAPSRVFAQPNVAVGNLLPIKLAEFHPPAEHEHEFLAPISFQAAGDLMQGSLHFGLGRRGMVFALR